MWSLHPSYLDTKGLVACWREALLAQKVLAGQTSGYRNHPQIERFRATEDPLTFISHFLEHIAQEADARGYNFNRGLILRAVADPAVAHIFVTTGQLDYEKSHLLGKLEVRHPQRATMLADAIPPVLHPLFTAVPGEIESWERP